MMIIIGSSISCDLRQSCQRRVSEFNLDTWTVGDARHSSQCDLSQPLTSEQQRWYETSSSSWQEHIHTVEIAKNHKDRCHQLCNSQKLNLQMHKTCSESVMFTILLYWLSRNATGECCWYSSWVLNFMINIQYTCCLVRNGSREAVQQYGTSKWCACGAKVCNWIFAGGKYHTC